MPLPAAIYRADLSSDSTVRHSGIGLCLHQFYGHVRLRDARFAGRAGAEEIRRALAGSHLRRRTADVGRFTGVLSAREHLTIAAKTVAEMRKY